MPADPAIGLFLHAELLAAARHGQARRDQFSRRGLQTVVTAIATLRRE
jgi:hypothetical protein